MSTIKVDNIVEKTTDNQVFVDKAKVKGLLQNPNTFNYAITVDANTNAFDDPLPSNSALFKSVVIILNLQKTK